MLLYIPNEKHKNLVFFDTEFNDRKLIQISMIIYENFLVENVPVYLLKGSINLYIKNEINYFFTNYTGITRDFLDNNAISEEDAADKINRFLIDHNCKETLFIAHGVKQDMELLESMGVYLDEVERYCTYTAAKRLLGRDKNLRLIDVCNDSGYFAEQHDAYSDAKNVVHAFSYLKLVEVAAK